MHGSNRTLGERCHDALVEAAQKKALALRAKKLAERTFDRVFLETEGKNLEDRKARARQEPRVIAMEDEAITAESDAIVAKAEADGFQIRFEEWRSRQANERAEMQLR